MASVQIWTDVWKPNVISVRLMSLSIVFGTPMTGKPFSCSSRTTPIEPSPPIAMMASRPWRSYALRTRFSPSSRANGWSRDVPRIVPPLGRMPRHRSTSSSS